MDWTTTGTIERRSAQPTGALHPAEVTVAAGASAAEVTALLALVEVVDLAPGVVEALPAAAAELAAHAGIPWRRRTDDPPVALVRLITKVAIRCPAAGGRHTAHLLDRLRASVT